MTVKRPTLVGATVDELIQLIEDRQLAAGDTLPSTADLAEQLDVSRTVVREAIAELAGQGLLMRRQGKDTTITFPGGREFERLLRLRSALGAPAERSLVQWQAVLLASAAGMAAREATLDDATELDVRLSVLRGAGSVEESVSAEEDFFLAIAEISNNDMMVLSIDGSAVLLRPGRTVVWAELRRDSAKHNEAYRSLDAIRDAIQSRNPEGAAGAMGRFLDATSATPIPLAAAEA
jgi:GntR family transcriptional repressor for pyruvate dehydrogenase complex